MFNLKNAINTLQWLNFIILLLHKKKSIHRCLNVRLLYFIDNMLFGHMYPPLGFILEYAGTHCTNVSLSRGSFV